MPIVYIYSLRNTILILNIMCDYVIVYPLMDALDSFSTKLSVVSRTRKLREKRLLRWSIGYGFVFFQLSFSFMDFAPY